VVRKEMEILLLSPRGLDYCFLWTFFRAMAPVFRCSWICKLLVEPLYYFWLASWCAWFSKGGVMNPRAAL